MDDDVRGRLASFDPRALAALPDPYPVLKEFRETCPVGHTDTYDGFWNLFRYEDVCAAAVDNETFKSRDNTIPSENLPFTPPPIMSDPPQHMQFRQPFLKRFSPQVCNELEDAIRAKVTELIDAFIERGTADLATELFIPFPAFAALRILGLPDEDFATFSRWARLVFTVPDEGHEDHDWAMELITYFAPLYEELTGSDDDTIPSIARNLQIDDREIDTLEFVMLLTTFVTAGLDTTTNTSAQIALLLDERPDLRRRLIDEPELMPSAIEELLRYLTPLPMLARIPNRDVEIDGVTLPEGEKVALHWLAANHDPAEFPDPEEVVLDRTPNRHLAFGRGPHRCIGLHLARLQLRVMLEELFSRLPDYEVIRDDVQRVGGITRQVHSLPVRFTPGPRKATTE